jgi:hypothetical protein
MDEEQKPERKRILRSGKGYLNPRVVRAVTFYVITACIILSVIVCILAIWERCVLEDGIYIRGYSCG